MSRNHRVSLRLALVTILCMAGADALAQSSGSQSLFTQDIISNRAFSKVSGVLWTRRPDRYTFEVVMPRYTRSGSGPAPVVALWLLGADGTAIPASRDAPAKPKGLVALQDPEVSYSVSLAAGQSAVAAVLKIDGDYFIQKLKPLD